jgi:hypothetical protein
MGGNASAFVRQWPDFGETSPVPFDESFHVATASASDSVGSGTVGQAGRVRPARSGRCGQGGRIRPVRSSRRGQTGRVRAVGSGR